MTTSQPQNDPDRNDANQDTSEQNVSNQDTGSPVQTSPDWWSDVQENRMLMVISMSMLALLCATWRLWLPGGEFPRVPLFSWALQAPPAADAAALVLLIASLALIAIGTLADWTEIQRDDGPSQSTPTRQFVSHSPLLIAAIGSLVWLMISDQHRMQPWAFQYAAMIAAVALCRSHVALMLMRGLVISMYIFAGLSKIDFQFAHTTGQQFLNTTMSLVGQSIDHWPDRWRVAAALMMPLLETGIGVAMFFRSWRSLAACAAVLMHGFLFLVLSPVGLNHQPGVLVWNAAAALVTLMLMGPGSDAARRVSPASASQVAPPRPESLPRHKVKTPRFRFERLAVAVIGFIIIAPPLAWLDYYDHWLAWGLYAPNNARVRLYVAPHQIAQLPESLQSCCSPPRPDWPMQQVDFDRWSIQQQGVPIYPQARFQAAVAMTLLQRSGIDQGFDVEIQSRSNPITGTRAVESYRQLPALQRALSAYHLGTTARRESPVSPISF